MRIASFVLGRVVLIEVHRCGFARRPRRSPFLQIKRAWQKLYVGQILVDGKPSFEYGGFPVLLELSSSMQQPRAGDDLSSFKFQRFANFAAPENPLSSFFQCTRIYVVSTWSLAE